MSQRNRAVELGTNLPTLLTGAAISFCLQLWNRMKLQIKAWQQRFALHCCGVFDKNGTYTYLFYVYINMVCIHKNRMYTLEWYVYIRTVCIHKNGIHKNIWTILWYGTVCVQYILMYTFLCIHTIHTCICAMYIMEVCV